MSRFFHPEFVNSSPFDDPGLLVKLNRLNRYLLFDLGQCSHVPSRILLKVTDIFVTHTHIDHFIGFDHVLRVFLARDKKLRFYGPEGFLRCLESKLNGYAWNLIQSYPLTIQAFEIRRDSVISSTYPAPNAFRPTNVKSRKRENSLTTICQDAHIAVESVILDHAIPCLAFSLSERMHIDINKEELQKLNAEPGEWLDEFKTKIKNQSDSNQKINVPVRTGNAIYRLGDLAARIALIRPGNKLGYVSDAKGNESNIAEIVRLVRNADHLFIEGAFSHADEELAMRRGHLTAKQAGEIAALAGVKRFSVFHFSRRYEKNASFLREEAQSAFEEKAGRMG